MTETMQFHDYIFRHNPQSITVSGGVQAVRHLCPGRGETVQALGPALREVRCVGSFFGATYAEALGQLEEFRRKAERAGASTLFLPGIAPFSAHLREFTFEASGDGCILPYRLLFVEGANE